MLVTAVAAVAIAALALHLSQAPRSAYKGRSTTAWVSRLGRPELVEKVRAMSAIKALGTNALPTVLTNLGQRDSKAKAWCNQLAQRFPAFHFYLATQTEWRWAMQALLLDSGPESRRAAVVALAQQSQHPEAKVRAAALESLCLSYAIYSEPEALGALKAAESDPDANVRNLSQRWMRSYNAIHARPNKTAPVDGGIGPLFEAGSFFPAATEP